MDCGTKRRTGGEARSRLPEVAAPAAAEKPASGSGKNEALFVMNELVLLLLQKGVLSAAEGKSLLQKLLT